MKNITDNAYNRHLSRSDPKFKLWRSAGLLLTYKCSAKCEFCYYRCSPQSGGLMPVETAISAWQSLKNLAGDNAKIHITGGEPFLYWDRLAEVLTEAKRLGLTPFDMVETNASWCTDRKTVAERLRFLDSYGMQRIKLSYDPFHAEYVELEKAKLLADTAAELLGPDRVLVRWREYLEQPQPTPSQCQAEYRPTIEKYPVRFTGRAGGKLAELFATKTAADFSSENCSQSLLGAQGVHIDPYGNVFSGVCSGIIIGNVNDKPLDTIWQEIDWRTMDFFDTLFTNGPAGLLKKAANYGYKNCRLYSSKCHFCTHLRQFFFDNGLYKSIIGPVECYKEVQG